MGKLIALFQSKVALAIIGAVLCGGSAAWIVSTPLHFSFFSSSPPAAAQFQSQAGVQGMGGATATPGAPTSGSTPRATPRTGSGQSVELHGTVVSVNANAGSFAIRLRDGSIKTIMVTAQTIFQGDATSLSSLRFGWLVEVQGVSQANGAVIAWVVNADNGI